MRRPVLGKRKRWIVLGVFVAAAVSAGVYLWFGRGGDDAVHYLTAEATVGTISQTIEADFSLSSESGTTQVAIGGGAASDDSSSTSDSSGSTSSTSSTSSTTTGRAVASGAAAGSTLASAAGPSGSEDGEGDSVFASAARTVIAQVATSDSSSPSPSPSLSPTETSTPTPTPTPTPSRTARPTPSPTASGGSYPSGGSGGGGMSGGSATSGSAASSTSSSSSASSTTSGIVTRLVAPAGASPATLGKLLYVSGKPIFAFVSDVPLWKNLSTSLESGTQTTNVTALQRALKKQGYYTKSVNGKFTTATKNAYKRWQKANGMSATGVVDVSRFVWMPTGSVLTSWTVGLGSHVSSASALADVVSPSRLTAEALISQADIADLEVGQEAEMTIDGYESDAFSGRITFISSEPASSESSSTSTQYSITVTPDELPDFSKSGMTGALDIVLEQRSDVLLVPTSAVTGSSSVSYVRVMQDGVPVARQVETGMATSSYTEITSGLAEGETVVTGQYTDDATSTSGSESGSSSGSILNGSGGMPAGGGGMPGGSGGSMPRPGSGGSQ